jgi:DNA-binding NarL/FixJ family response regulator
MGLPPMSTMHRPTVLLADDHAIVTEGLMGLLKEQFDVVGAVGDGRLLVATAKRLRPDVIVTDISMPGLSGLDALRQLRTERITSRVIVLTMHADPELAADVMRAGAAGYLLKHAAGDELVMAMHEVLQGHVYLTPAMTKDVLERLTAPPGPPQTPLTPRQREVLRLIAEGRRMKEIAAALQLSTRTVETHKYDMMQTLGVQSTAELVRYAIQHGLVSS